MRVSWFVAVGCGLLLACGDDDEVVFSSGLPPDQRLSDSSADELRMACVAFRDAVDRSLGPDLDRLDCLAAALRDSVSITLNGEIHGDVPRCQQLVDACEADGGVRGADAVLSALRGVNCSTPLATAGERTCDATAAEYERCRNASIDELEVLVSSENCGNAIANIERTQQLNQAQPRMVAPPLCAELMQQCPQINVPATHPVQ